MYTLNLKNGKSISVPLSSNGCIDIKSLLLSKENNIEDLYVNATSICKAAGKFIKHWKRRKETQAYLQAVSNETGIPVFKLIKFDTGYGSKQVTWVHPLVSQNIFQWTKRVSTKPPCSILYIVSSSVLCSHSYFKVGITGNIKQRLDTFTNFSPVRVFAVTTWDDTQSRLVEQEVLDILSSFKTETNNEFVCANYEYIEMIISNILYNISIVNYYSG